MGRQMGYILVTAALILATSVQAGTAGNTPAEQACLDAFMNDLAGKFQPAPRLREASSRRVRCRCSARWCRELGPYGDQSAQ